MDRDKNYDRLKLAYDLYTEGKGEKSTNILASIQKSYDNGVTDEFMKPIVMVDDNDQPLATIEEGDVVIVLTSVPTVCAKQLLRLPRKICLNLA